MDEARLQEMWDHHEIRQLLATYCHGCDRGDEVEMASVYAADSWDDHGTRKMEGRRFSVETVEECLRLTKVVHHTLGQSYIRVKGDEAGAETYFIATVIYPDAEDENAPDTLNLLGGRYVDALVREEGAWKISRRLCVREWSSTQPIESDWLAGAGFIPGRTGPADVSWDVLGLSHAGNPWLHEVEAAE